MPKKKIHVTAEERELLLKLGLDVGLSIWHLLTIVSEYVRNCHKCRPHQGIGNALLRKPGKDPPGDEPVTLPLSLSEIKCEKQLDGLPRHYYRDASLWRSFSELSRISCGRGMRGRRARGNFAVIDGPSIPRLVPSCGKLVRGERTFRAWFSGFLCCQVFCTERASSYRTIGGPNWRLHT